MTDKQKSVGGRPRKDSAQTSKPRMGRPPKPFDPKMFERLCYIQCTQEEIAACFEMSIDCLENKVFRHYGETLSVIFDQKRQNGKQSLRRAQWKKAVVEQNPTMLIWLGKQYLKQTDKLELEGESAKAQEIKVVIEDYRTKE